MFVPKYRHHKGSGQALVQINGKRIYLGKHGTPESRERYRRFIAELMATDAKPETKSPTDPKLTINEVILAYYRFAKTYYVKNGESTDEIHGIRAALKRLKNLYGHDLADEFGPKAFKLLRETMIQDGRSRKYINDSMARIRRMFRWAASEELVPAHVYQALAAVPGLKKDRSDARETEPVRPVSEDDFAKALQYMPRVVADMARVQRFTGCRPHEICIMRPGDITRPGDVWEYRPERHKSEHRQRSRVVFIGPQAQTVLRPYLLRVADKYCFSPLESERSRRGTNNVDRKIAKTASQRNRAPRDHYDRHSYRRAVQRACQKAGVSKWSPGQLRHSTATHVRQLYGLEAAQNVLGHSNADVTQIYAERDMARAREVMREVG